MRRTRGCGEQRAASSEQYSPNTTSSGRRREDRAKEGDASRQSSCSLHSLRFSSYALHTYISWAIHIYTAVYTYSRNTSQ